MAKAMNTKNNGSTKPLVTAYSERPMVTAYKEAPFSRGESKAPFNLLTNSAKVTPSSTNALQKAIKHDGRVKPSNDHRRLSGR